MTSNQHLQTAGVYAIGCKQCNSFYFGESGRSVNIRINEHKRAVMEYAPCSAIAKHCWENDHVMDWEETKIIYKSKM